MLVSCRLFSHGWSHASTSNHCDTFEVYQEMEGTAYMVVDFNGYGFKTRGKLSPKIINRKLYKCKLRTVRLQPLLGLKFLAIAAAYFAQKLEYNHIRIEIHLI